jgi:hypothetical protein
MADIPEYKPPKPDAAPKGAAAPKANPSKGKGRSSRPKPKPTMPVDDIRSELTEFMVGAGLIMMMKNEGDALIVIGGTPDVVDAWCDLAEKNPYVHIVLQKFCESGDAAKVISTTVPLALALAANHGMYKGPLPVSRNAYAQKAVQVMEEMDIDTNVNVVEDDEPSTNGTSAASNTPVVSAVP